MPVRDFIVQKSCIKTETKIEIIIKSKYKKIMKKLILMAVAIVFGTAVMSAQDMSKATETYNAGAEALQIGSNETALKKFDASLENGNNEEKNNAYKAAVSTVDKVASKGVINKNAANNKKAALGKKLNSIEK